MDILKTFEELLPITSPFVVNSITKDEEKKEVYIHLGVEKDYRPNEDCRTIHQYYERKWEHINLFQYRCFITCRLPVYFNEKTGKTQALQVPFSRPSSRLTLLYEARVLELLRIHQCQKTVAQSLKINTQRVEKIFHDYTAQAYDAHIIEPCKKVGIDETSTRKGHNYFTIFVDMETGKPINIEDGKGSETIASFFHNNVNPGAVEAVSMDMSPSFISGCEVYLPWAKLTFDKWHVYRLLGKSLTELLKKYKNKEDNINVLWENLKEFYAQTDFELAKAQLAFIADYAESVFGKNKFSASIRRHFDGIVEHIRSKLTNGILEGINSRIQTLKRIAKGFRCIENFKKMVFFIFDVIQPKIPKTT